MSIGHLSCGVRTDWGRMLCASEVQKIPREYQEINSVQRCFWSLDRVINPPLREWIIPLLDEAPGLARSTR